MNYFFVFLFLCVVNSFGGCQFSTDQEKKKLNSEFNFNVVINPLMPLSQDLFATISTANRQEFLQNSELEKHIIQHNIATLKHKSIPWELLMGILAIAGVILISKNHLKKTEINKKAESIEELEARAKESLHLALENDLIKKGAYREYILQLESALRLYFESKYQLNAQFFTTEELIAVLRTNSKIDSEMSSQLIAFFQTIDRIKYSNYQPSLELCLSLSNMSHAPR